MTDEFEEDVFEVMDDLRGDNRVAVPDIGTIRRRAQKQQNQLRAAGGAAFLAIVAAVGVGVWASVDDSPATTETAGADQDVDGSVMQELPAVAGDSAPTEVVGGAAEQLVEWMEQEDLRTSDRAAWVRATSSVFHPDFEEVRLNLGAFHHDGAHEFFLIVNAGCGPMLSYGMIEFEGDTAQYRRDQLPESNNIGFDDIGYECQPSQPDRLNTILSEGFTLSTGAGGLSISNDTDRLLFAPTDMSYEPKSENTPVNIPAPARVDIVTGEPEGGRGWNALSSFTLQYDADLNCLYHDEPDNNGEPGTGGRVVIVWPAGYTAVRDSGGGVAVRNPDGDIVARSGETFQIGGGMRTVGSGHCDSIGEWVANGGPETQTEPEPAVVVVDVGATEGGLLVRTDPDYVADGAEFVGELTLEDGCVFLSSGRPEQTKTPVVWPFGTQWQIEPPGMLRPNGTFIAVGDEVGFGGGVGGQRLRDSGLPEEVLDVLNHCAEPGDLAIISLG